MAWTLNLAEVLRIKTVKFDGWFGAKFARLWNALNLTAKSRWFFWK